MNKFELYMVINEIDEKLIEEASDTANDSSRTFSGKRPPYSIVKVAVVITIIICSALCYKAFTSPAFIPLAISPSETAVTTSQRTTENKQTTVTEKSTDSDGLNTDTVTNDNEPTTKISGTAFPDYSLYTLSMWLNEPSVIWSENETKGGITVTEKATFGTVKITDTLKEMFESNDENSVYAVLVDFSSCINENEVDNWFFDGTSLSVLRKEFNKSDKDDEAITEYKNNIRKIKDAYYEMKIKSFQDTFSRHGMKIYKDKKAVDLSTYFFYTFATEKQLKSLICKIDEAFVITSAGRNAF